MLCSMRYPAFFETGPSIQCSWGKFTNEIAADRKGPEFRQGMPGQASAAGIDSCLWLSASPLARSRF